MSARLSPSDLEAYCRAQGVAARLHRLDVPTPTVPDAAAAVATTPERIVKSLVFLARGEPLLVVAAGEGRVRYPLLARALGVNRKELRFATAEEALEITGFPVGAMPPFGHARPLATLLDDASLPASGAVFGGGGAVDALMEVEVAELERATGGRRVSLTEAAAEAR
ncbi:MAG: YbaK/EbsC family protein [Deinococcales bacterium]|nr:YbaK/EbsC family protein [Deinococcales bacterium]